MFVIINLFVIILFTFIVFFIFIFLHLCVIFTYILCAYFTVELCSEYAACDPADIHILVRYKQNIYLHCTKYSPSTRHLCFLLILLQSLSHSSLHIPSSSSLSSTAPHTRLHLPLLSHTCTLSTMCIYDSPGCLCITLLSFSYFSTISDVVAAAGVVQRISLNTMHSYRLLYSHGDHLSMQFFLFLLFLFCL